MSSKNNRNKTDIVKKFLVKAAHNKLLGDSLERCDDERIKKSIRDKECSKKGRSSQQVFICNSKKVYKGPKRKNINVFQLKVVKTDGVYIAKLTNNDLNLLIQSVFQDTLFSSHQLEKYNSICDVNTKLVDFNYREGLTANSTYSLVSNSVDGVPTFDKTKVSKTLEEYVKDNIPYFKDKMDEYKEIFIPAMKRYIKQLFSTLDFLYQTIQFHHCDPKAGQLLLKDKRSLMLSDFDKATFTLNVDNTPVRFTNRYNFEVLISLANIPTQMRIDKLPRKNCHFEKLCFLGSILLSFEDTTYKPLYDILLEELNKDNIIEYNKEDKIGESAHIYLPGDNNIHIEYEKIKDNIGKPDRLRNTADLIGISSEVIFNAKEELYSEISIPNIETSMLPRSKSDPYIRSHRSSTRKKSLGRSKSFDQFPSNAKKRHRFWPFNRTRRSPRRSPRRHTRRTPRSPRHSSHSPRTSHRSSRTSHHSSRHKHKSHESYAYRPRR